MQEPWQSNGDFLFGFHLAPHDFASAAPPPLPGLSAPVPTEEPEDFTIKVGWRLKDIDWPICLNYFELDYYDNSYNESGFIRQFKRPFQRKFEMEVSSRQVPCEEDYSFIARHTEHIFY